jgi:Cu2+-exporting ATPase
MKKSIFLGALTLILGLIMISSCSNDSSNVSNHDAEHMESTTFYCPMKCEGEKTYDDPGVCPKCGMDLVEKN